MSKGQMRAQRKVPGSRPSFGRYLKLPHSAAKRRQNTAHGVSPGGPGTRPGGASGNSPALQRREEWSARSKSQRDD